MNRLNFVKLTLCSIIFVPLITNGAFEKVSTDYNTVVEESEVPNMPRIRSQDSLGLCQSFSGATMLQHQYCVVYKIQDCSKISSSVEISPLNVWSYLTPNKAGQELGVRENHTHVNIKDQATVSRENKGFLIPLLAILNMVKAAVGKSDGFRLCSEKAFPFDQFANKYGQSEEAMNTILSKLDDVYQTQRKKIISTEASATEVCNECLQATITEVNQILPRPLSVESNSKLVERSLRKETFGEFLYEIMFSKCGDITMPIPKIGEFPEAGKSSTKQELKNKLIEVLKTKTPVSYGPICVDRSAADKCGQHNIVISGYKKVKNSNGDVKELFKIQNSWGEEWQKASTNDGWVDSKGIIDNYFSEKVVNSSLYWFPPQ